MTKDKQVLIITYYWPPSGGPGVQRWLKLVKYLPQFGICPVVLTVDPADAEYPVIDESLSADINPELKVYRTNCRSVYDWYKKITGSATAPYSGFANEGNPSFIQKAARFIRGNFFLPDARRSWIKYAYPRACRLIEEYRIDTVITTGPPHSTHLTGLKLKKKYDVKWIADFRDPWTAIYYNDFLYQTYAAKKIDARYERSVLEHCDHLLVTNKKSLKVNPGKVTFFPNGYDETDFAGKKRVIPQVFTICYTGTAAANYPMDGLLDALDELRDEFPFQLRFVGKINAELQSVYKLRLGNHVEFIDFVPHSRSIDYLFAASVLLLVIPQTADNKYIVPGKLFEYLASGTPVLMLGPADSIPAQTVQQAQAGTACDGHDTEGIKEFLTRHNHYYIQQLHPSSDTDFIKQFSRKSLTRQLSELIK